MHMYQYHEIRKNYAINCAIQGMCLISKQKIWLAICEFLWSLTNQNAWFCFLFLHCLKKNCTALNQSEWRNFFMYIISGRKIHLKSLLYRLPLINGLYTALRTVPTVVIAHTFCASLDTWISYRQCLLIQGYFCVV